MDNEKENSLYGEKSNDFEKKHMDYKNSLKEDYIHMKILNELTKNSPDSVKKTQEEPVLEEETECIENQEIEQKMEGTAVNSPGEDSAAFQFSSDKIEKYREEFKKQHSLHENVISDYKKWISRIEELAVYIKKGYENTEKEYSKDELNVELRKITQADEVSCSKLFNMDSLGDFNEEQIKNYINANHNIIEESIKEKDSAADKYFVLVNSYIFPLIDNFNFKLSMDRDIEEEKQKKLQKITGYKEQLQSDNITWEKSLLEYRTWLLRNKELLLSVEKNCIDISHIIENFNSDIEHKMDILEEKDKELLKNRIKGINMINKMCQNMLNTGLSKIRNVEEKNYDKLCTVEDFEHMGEEQITNIFNSNYNIITGIRNEKDSIVRSYFKFINSQLLPILDGVDSGIQYLNNNNITALKYIIWDIYEDMDKVLKKLLENIKVREIRTNKNESINFNLHQAIDVEYTQAQEMDETVAEVIRKGYEYLEDIYSTGINYIVRQVQVIAYKFKAPENTSV